MDMEHQFIWCSIIQVILDHWSWSQNISNKSTLTSLIVPVKFAVFKKFQAGNSFFVSKQFHSTIIIWSRECFLIIIGKEDYEELKECLGETFKEIEVVKSEGLEIDGEPFDVEWWVAKQIFLAKSNLFCCNWWGWVRMP